MNIPAMTRRKLLQLGLSTAGATLTPRWILAQAPAPTAPPQDRAAQMRAGAATTPIKTTKLYDNVFLLQGAGGNMAVQTGPDGKLLIDSSFSTAVPRIREALDALGKDPADTLINTHWHIDHVDGNEGMHSAGFRVVAHRATRDRMSTPQEIKLLKMTFAPSPAAALPSVTFDDSLHMFHNGDSIDLAHFDPSHTDTDIFIHFHNADVLHLGDIWFNGVYPLIDESSGGNINGMIHGSEKSLSLAGPGTKIIPGHGPLGTKAQFQQYHDMLAGIRDRVAALKSSGASEQETIAQKPSASYDAVWGKGGMTPDVFVGIVYRTV
jgi:glyoxylase-like metal-dependent hydrolase (beta-lactamase superfamily II)